MKKNLIKTAMVAAFCFAIGYTAYNAQSQNGQLCELALANVEALARYELPEVEITCGKTDGACSITSGHCVLDYMGLLTAQDCVFTGYMAHYCVTPCR